MFISQWPFVKCLVCVDVSLLFNSVVTYLTDLLLIYFIVELFWFYLYVVATNLNSHAVLGLSHCES